MLRYETSGEIPIAVFESMDPLRPNCVDEVRYNRFELAVRIRNEKRYGTPIVEMLASVHRDLVAIGEPDSGLAQ